MERYNTFITNREASGYKLQLEADGDVNIIDMPSIEHERIANEISVRFNAANGMNPQTDRPIEISSSPGKKIYFST